MISEARDDGNSGTYEQRSNLDMYEALSQYYYDRDYLTKPLTIRNSNALNTHDALNTGLIPSPLIYGIQGARVLSAGTPS